MKSFSISLEQRGLLLEMAQKLYPQFNSVVLVKQNGNQVSTTTKGIEFKSDMLQFPFLDKTIVGSYIAYKYIHWLEFCMFELAERIYLPNPLKINRNLSIQLKDFYWSCSIYWSNPSDDRGEHPVNYLYKQFQLIK